MDELAFVSRMLVAVALGGAIGVEREIKGHAAGLRTHMLVCLGAALFMIGAELLALRFVDLPGGADPSRIGSTIVTGVSFLGAGIIFQSQRGARNLTTAASIWVVAAIGLLSGIGTFIAATAATAIVLVVLVVLPAVERGLTRHIKPPPAPPPVEGQSPPPALPPPGPG